LGLAERQSRQVRKNLPLFSCVEGQRRIVKRIRPIAGGEQMTVAYDIAPPRKVPKA